MDRQRFWGFLAHASIIIGMMFVIFFVIDRFNPAMEFLSSSISKWLILAFAICSILNGLFSAVFLFQKQKRHEERHGSAPLKAAPDQNSVPQRRLAQAQYDPHASRQSVRTGYGCAAGYPAQEPLPASDRQYRRPASAAGRPQADFRYQNPRARR